MIRKIEIEFPFDVEIPDTLIQLISRTVDHVICKPYEISNPDRRMWVSEYGSKPSYSYSDAMFLGKQEWDESIKNGDEPVFDDSVYHIGISEREA